MGAYPSLSPGPETDTALLQVIGWENIELISDRPLEVMLDEFARLKKEFPGRILIASIMEEYNKVHGLGFGSNSAGSRNLSTACHGVVVRCIRVTRPCATCAVIVTDTAVRTYSTRTYTKVHKDKDSTSSCVSRPSTILLGANAFPGLACLQL